MQSIQNLHAKFPNKIKQFLCLGGTCSFYIIIFNVIALNSTGVKVLSIGFAMRSKRKLQGKQRAIVRKRFLRHEARCIQHHGA